VVNRDRVRKTDSYEDEVPVQDMGFSTSGWLDYGSTALSYPDADYGPNFFSTFFNK
jgi:hypothetical protein